MAQAHTVAEPGLTNAPGEKLTLCLDVCIGGLRIELVSIPIQRGNCNGYEYEFTRLDAHGIRYWNLSEVSIPNPVWMANSRIA